jgi:DNA polymerase III alpha subunit
MNYTDPEEKKAAMKIFNEIQEINSKIVSLINDYSAQLIQNKKNIEKQIQGCNNDLENIRQNNMASSEKMNELQKDTKEIIKDINDLLKFCWIKEKIPQINKDLKGFQLYDIKSKMEEGTKNVIKANEKLEVNLSELKTFVKEKEETLNQFFSLDLVFIMDITGSMEKFVNFTKEKINSIINKIKEETTVIVRLGFIGYRDYLDNKNLEYYKFPELSTF